jgi:hypothetical protein
MFRKVSLLIVGILVLFAAVAPAQEDTAAQDTTMTAQPAEPETPMQDALVVESKFCTGVEERMPVGEAETFPADVDNVYMWCRVTGCQDTTAVTQVWSYEGEEMARVDLPVRSPNWRTWVSKTILPEWTGDWEVKVFDTEGNVLKAGTFTITAVEPADTTEATPEAPEDLE